MGEIKDGGPAFPQTVDLYAQDLKGVNCGMSLRDWFAGMALSNMATELPAGYCDRPEYECNYENRAENAYKYADAMLQAREAKKT